MVHRNRGFTHENSMVDLSIFLCKRLPGRVTLVFYRIPVYSENIIGPEIRRQPSQQIDIGNVRIFFMTSRRLEWLEGIAIAGPCIYIYISYDTSSCV